MNRIQWWIKNVKIQCDIQCTQQKVRNNPYYLNIVSLGIDSIPEIINEIKISPHWVFIFILNDITHKWPLPVKKGKVQPLQKVYNLTEVSEAWLKWYDKQNNSILQKQKNKETNS